MLEIKPFSNIRLMLCLFKFYGYLRERINHAVLSLSEQGIIEALQVRWFSPVNSDCSVDDYTKRAKNAFIDVSTTSQH